MRILVTGSSGHLGEALVRTLRAQGREVVGVDLLESAFTDVVGSIADRAVVRGAMKGVHAVLHAATLHKPHVGTHERQEFVDTNITGTLNLLEEAREQGVEAFVFTSTTSTFGSALTPGAGEPAAWITEDVRPVPRNIYGVTKTAAEDVVELFHRKFGMPCLILRTSRFFPEEDDHAERRSTFADENLKVNEFLHRRVEIEDVVSAHRRALEKAEEIGFGRYIISATTPFEREELAELRKNAAAVVRRRVPEYEEEYARRGWKMFDGIDRVYVNEKARMELGWEPRYDFRSVLRRLRSGLAWNSDLAQQIGSKGYHEEKFAVGPYPLEKG